MKIAYWKMFDRTWFILKCLEPENAEEDLFIIKDTNKFCICCGYGYFSNVTKSFLDRGETIQYCEKWAKTLGYRVLTEAEANLL